MAKKKTKPKPSPFLKGLLLQTSLPFIWLGIQCFLPPDAFGGMRWLWLLINGILCAAMLFFILRPTETSPLPDKLTVSAILLLTTAAHGFLTARMWILLLLLMEIVCPAFLFSYLLWHRKGGFCTLIAGTVAGYTCLYLVFRGSDYTFASGVLFPFWQILLAVGIAGGILITLWVRRREKKLLIRIFCFLGSVLMITMVLGFTVSHLNYALDFRTPQDYTVEIEKKDHDIVRRGPDRYQFKVTADGNSFWIEVPEKDFSAHKVGDTYSIRRYAGALGQAFFISGNMDT